MRDKKMFLSVIWITTVMLLAGGCGKQTEPVSADPTETVKEVDTEESTEEGLEESSEPTSSPTALPEESKESSEDETAVEDNTVAEDEVIKDDGIIPIDDTVMYAAGDCNIRSGAGTQYDKVGSLSKGEAVTVNGKVESDEDKLWYVIKTEDGSTQMVSASMLSETKPVTQTSSNKTDKTDKSKTEEPKTEEPKTESTPEPAQPTPAPAQPTPEPAPVHEHSWKEHTASTQTWIPNIVVVDDYETQRLAVGEIFHCNCGYDTSSRDDIKQHGINHVLAGEFDNFSIEVLYEEQQVKVGSHEEDHGYYETSTYVDYYYCDCGATKN